MIGEAIMGGVKAATDIIGGIFGFINAGKERRHQAAMQENQFDQERWLVTHQQLPVLNNLYANNDNSSFILTLVALIVVVVVILIIFSTVKPKANGSGTGTHS